MKNPIQKLSALNPFSKIKKMEMELARLKNFLEEHDGRLDEVEKLPRRQDIEDLRDEIKDEVEDTFQDRLFSNLDYGELSRHIDIAQIVDEFDDITDHLDLTQVASGISYEDLAAEISYSTLSEELDSQEIADKVDKEEVAVSIKDEVATYVNENFREALRNF